MAKQKIAVLGGGAGSLTAALGLTSYPGWQDKYEITVYQVGWRLGGKGASGRNAAQHQRVEEHGLHVWGGFYWNAFRAMRTCYGEMRRPPGSPLATVWDAFKPKSDCTVTEFIDGQWLNWAVTMPTNGDLPGDDFDAPTVEEHIRNLLKWMLDRLENGGLFGELRQSNQTHPYPPVSDSLWERVISIDSRLRRNDHPSIQPEHREPSTFDRALSTVGEAVQWLATAARRLAHAVIVEGAVDHTVFKYLGEILSRVRSHLSDWFTSNPKPEMPLRREFLVLDYGFTTILGLIEDDVLTHGFSSIDDIEWRDWLKKHGAADSTVDSVITKATYDYVFGYLNGDVSTPSIGAGTCTHGLLLLTLCYQGAIFFEMQAGMGDSVFAPLYIVLKNRGVRFEFFKRVDAIRLDSQDKNMIGSIDLGVQMTVRGGGPYEPLVDVEGLPCWPSTPCFDQLDRGEELKWSAQNLESPWADWQDAAKTTLQRGKDFDLVVLGISVAALPALTPELMAANPKWSDMVTQIRTAQTQAMQLWMKSSSEELGWTTEAAPLITGYTDDMNTWGDLSHLLAREAWPTGLSPKNEAYFCGPLQDVAPIAPYTDHTFPDRMAEKVKSDSITWLKANAAFLMPKLGTGSDFAWDQLIAPTGTQGEARFDSQYWRANVAPSERYVISAAGTTKFRLPADGSGFGNLYLAGDWVQTQINAGCVEAAVMAGLSASQAICGYPEQILGVRPKAK